MEGTLKYLQRVVTKDKDHRAAGLRSFGQIVGAVRAVRASELKLNLDWLFQWAQKILSERKHKGGQDFNDTLICISEVACLQTSFSYGLSEKIGALLDTMFEAGLSTPLVTTLQNIMFHVKSLRSRVTQLLLGTINVILVKSASDYDEKTDYVDVCLALQVMGTFEFGQGLEQGSHHERLAFVHERVLPLVFHHTAHIRELAALACACQLSPPISLDHRVVDEKLFELAKQDVHFQRVSNVLLVKPRYRQLEAQRVKRIVSSLLRVCISDSSFRVRVLLLNALNTPLLDKFLVIEEHTCYISRMFTDDTLEVKLIALNMLGRLFKSYAMIALPLEVTLSQLLGQLQGAGSHDEQQVQLLVHFIRHVPQTAQKHAESIAQIVLPWFEESAAELTPATIEAIGELAQIKSDQLSVLPTQVVPKLLELFTDYTSTEKRIAAIKAFGMIAQGTAYIVQPFQDFPWLSTLLRRLLRTEGSVKVLHELVRLAGILCLPAAATSDLERTTWGNDDHRCVIDSTDNTVAAVLDKYSLHATTGSDSYFTVVAINALMRVANDPAQIVHHPSVFQVVVVIFAHLKSAVLDTLPRVVPSLLRMVRLSRDSRDESDEWMHMVASLVELVDIAGKRIQPTAGLLFDFIFEAWSADMPFFHLVQSLVDVLREDAVCFMNKLLPKLQEAIVADTAHDRPIARGIFPVLITAGKFLDGWLHVLLPTIVGMIGNSNIATLARSDALTTLIQVSEVVTIGDFASLTFHALAHAIDTSTDLRDAAMEMIYRLLRQMGKEFLELGFHDILARILANQRVKEHLEYTRLLLQVANNGNFTPLNPTTFPHHANRFDSGSGRVDRFANSFDRFLVDDDDDDELNHSLHGALRVDQVTLQQAWEVIPATEDEWSEWIKQFGRALLKESTSPALRACSLLAEVHAPIVRELFNAAFVSCWEELYLGTQDELVDYFEHALNDRSRTTREITRALLNLAEFMDSMHKGPLPISTSTLAKSSVSIQAYAKALRYKETEFKRFGYHNALASSGKRDDTGNEVLRRGRTESMMTSLSQQLVNTIADLVEINTALQQHEAALGCLAWTVKVPSTAKMLETITPALNEKLGHWEKALGQYTQVEQQAMPRGNVDFSITMGHMRCLVKLGMWDELVSLAESKRGIVDADQWRSIARKVGREGASAAQWEKIVPFAEDISDHDGALIIKAMLAIHHGRYGVARAYITGGRRFLNSRIASIVDGRHDRFQDYVQTMIELEECIDYKLAPASSHTRQTIRTSWRKRLDNRGAGYRRDPVVWERVLNLRSLAVSPVDDPETYVEFSRVCQEAGNVKQAREVLVKLLAIDPAPRQEFAKGTSPILKYAYTKHLWRSWRQDEAFARLEALAKELCPADRVSGKVDPVTYNQVKGSIDKTTRLSAQCYHKLGQWFIERAGKAVLTEEMIEEANQSYSNATLLDPLWQRAWHAYSIFNFRVALGRVHEPASASTIQHVTNSINGFVRSIGLSSGNLLQDALHVLRLWWAYGSQGKVLDSINEARASIKVDTWLLVVPQLVARIDVKDEMIKQSIHEALIEIGHQHPQAMVFPLSVAARSESRDRSLAGRKLMARLKQHSSELVQQANLVADELIRTGILWQEEWHTALLAASNKFYENQDVNGMVSALEPLHQKIKKPTTLREIAFVQAFGTDLDNAKASMAQCQQTGDIRLAYTGWDHYYSVYQRITKTLPLLKVIDLKSAAPKLLQATDLVLAVPGTYSSNDALVTISSFKPMLEVIISKQRPRKLTIVGCDGRDYEYLLKGQEDPRMDERVMNTFSLVNNMLDKDPATSQRDLLIRTYSITPLSPQAGLIGWVSNCNTLHDLIRQHRKKNKIIMHAEHKLVRKLAPQTADGSGRPNEDGYDNLPVLQRVELFEQGLASQKGDDLAQMLWHTSPSAEIWLERRNNYTKSLAVMSMVGYVLGLGDRHPSNIMIDRRTGFVQHIDFGDCFEVAQQRAQYPERIPFRLTRMLVNAMDISGVDGPYRWTCENTMRVMRKDPDSIIAILETFKHDPVIDDRATIASRKGAGGGDGGGGGRGGAEDVLMARLSGANRAGSQSSMRSITEKPTPTATPTPTPGSRKRLNSSRSTHSIYGQHTFATLSLHDQKLVYGVNTITAALIQHAQLSINKVHSKLLGHEFVEGAAAADTTTTTTGGGGGAEGGLEVKGQVSRLIAEATSSENLAQLFTGWCPYW